MADPLLALVLATLGWLAAAPWRRAATGARLRIALRSMLILVALAGAGTTWFLASWGLNYRRAPLAIRLDHDPARVDEAAVRRAATTAVSELNALYAGTHDRPWAEGEALRAGMAPVLAEALREIALPDGFVAGLPKRTWLGPWFEAAGIAGFTNPWSLDVIIVPSALPFERPAMLLHEWGHLAGLAHEAEAGFIGWLAGMRGTPQVRYSAWLDLLPHLTAMLPLPAAKAVMAGLDEGPREDYRAIARRLEQVRPMVRHVAWSGYRRFLEANTVAEGLRSYDGVASLVVGTAFDEGWRPRLRGRGQQPRQVPERQPGQ